MKLLALCAMSLSFAAFAQSESPKHQITLGNDSFGWSGSGASADTDDSLGIKDFNFAEGNFNINYMYRILPNIQIGAAIESSTDNSEIKYKDGGKLTDEDTVMNYSVRFTFNTHEELKNSFFITAALGKGTFKNETKDTSDGTKSSTKYDATIISGSFGKRFSMEGLGIQNLVYSPQVTVASAKFGGDLEDSGVNSAVVVQLDIIRFDLLF